MQNPEETTKTNGWAPIMSLIFTNPYSTRLMYCKPPPGNHPSWCISLYGLIVQISIQFLGAKRRKRYSSGIKRCDPLEELIYISMKMLNNYAFPFSLYFWLFNILYYYHVLPVTRALKYTRADVWIVLPMDRRWKLLFLLLLFTYSCQCFVPVMIL